MEQDTVTVKRVLNAYQIAGLALATSTFVAVAVLVVLRRTILSRPTTDDRPGAAGPAVDAEISSQTPRHFSEDLIVPGFTETGSDILKDQDEGRPSAGNV